MMHRALDNWKNIQLYLWLLFFAYLLHNGLETSYLAPLQIAFFYAGCAVLLLLLIAGLLPGNTQEAPPLPGGLHLRLALETLSHGVPLLLILLAGMTTLNLNVATLRDGIQMRILDPNRSPTTLEESIQQLPPGGYLETSHLQLYGNPRLQQGVAVTLIGRLSRLQGKRLQESFPQWHGEAEVLLLYRFAIACCAADASPVAVLLENVPDGTAVQEEAWYEVRGKSRSLPGEERLLAIQVEQLQTIAPPKKPYLSWLEAN
ncbi:MAG: hypothetical protein HQM06_07240 [Magnetococcales bacterium]|nr:hypothetical protein [Magnetococcales bacterium]